MSIPTFSAWVDSANRGEIRPNMFDEIANYNVENAKAEYNKLLDSGMPVAEISKGLRIGSAFIAGFIATGNGIEVGCYYPPYFDADNESLMRFDSGINAGILSALGVSMKNINNIGAGKVFRAKAIGSEAQLVPVDNLKIPYDIYANLQGRLSLPLSQLVVVSTTSSILT